MAYTVDTKFGKVQAEQSNARVLVRHDSRLEIYDKVQVVDTR